MNGIARLLLVAMLVALAAACGGKAGAQSDPSTTAAPTTTRTANPYYDSGSTVTITAQGFEPRELVAEVNVPIRFVNRTTTVQRVQFDTSRDAAGNLRASGAIAPGASWSYTPTSWESATYHSLTTPPQKGQIQIQPPANP